MATMKLKYIYLALYLGIISSSCKNRESVCINGICNNYTDGTLIELYYLQNDSVITIGYDTLLHGKFNFNLEENPEMAYYLSVNDTMNPMRGMFFP